MSLSAAAFCSVLLTCHAWPGSLLSVLAAVLATLAACIKGHSSAGMTMGISFIWHLTLQVAFHE